MSRTLLFPVTTRDKQIFGDRERSSAGISLTACIIWGDMGPSFQAKAQPEAQDGHAHILGTSTAYPNVPEDRPLRKALLRLRRNQFLEAYPTLRAVEAEHPSSLFGPCSEHMVWTRCVSAVILYFYFMCGP